MRNLRHSLMTLLVILFVLYAAPVDAQKRGQRPRDRKQQGQTQAQPNPATPPPPQEPPRNSPPPQQQQPEKAQESSNPQKEQQSKDIIIISLAINWADLWVESASLQEVPQAERDENIREVLLEVGNKMKRRHKVSELIDFKVKKVSQNLALVEYPLLSGQSEIELNLIANQLKQIGGTVLNVNIFVNNKAVQIVDMGLGSQSQTQQATQEQQPPQQHEGINEKPVLPNPVVDNNPGNPYAQQNQQQQQQPPKQPQQQKVPNYQEEINQVVAALESYDKTLQRMHDDNEKMVADYHEKMNAIDAKMKELKDAIDREYLPKFKEEEDKYQMTAKEVQERYNVVYYERADAEEEYYRLLNEEEEYRRTAGRVDEL